MTIANSTGKHTSSQALRSILLRMSDAESINSLEIEHSSTTEDVSFVDAFPSLQILRANGHALRTLTGIENFRGEWLAVNTANKGVSLAALRESRVRTLELRWWKNEDLVAIAGCKSLERVVLTACKRLDNESIRGSLITALTVASSTTTSVPPSDVLTRLSDLHLSRCPQIGGIQGDFHTLRRLIVNKCKRFAIESLVAAPLLESLSLFSLQGEQIRLDSPLQNLKEITIRNCKWPLAAIDKLLKMLPALRVAHLDDLSPSDCAKLLENHRSISFQDG